MIKHDAELDTLKRSEQQNNDQLDPDYVLKVIESSHIDPGTLYILCEMFRDEIKASSGGDPSHAGNMVFNSGYCIIERISKLLRNVKNSHCK